MILDQAQLYTDKRLWLLVENHSIDQALARLLKAYPGPYPVILHYQDSKETLLLEGSFVEVSPELEKKLADLVMKTVFR